MNHPHASQMRTSLSELTMSTRLRNVLTTMAEFSTIHSWQSLIEAYRENPQKVDRVFLRTPGAGRRCRDELHKLIEPELRGIAHHGDVVFLSPEDVQRVRDTIDEACTHCPESLCNDLRTLQAFFTATTIRTRLP